jgi:hypothetical protein
MMNDPRENSALGCGPQIFGPRVPNAHKNWLAADLTLCRHPLFTSLRGTFKLRHTNSLSSISMDFAE